MLIREFERQVEKSPGKIAVKKGQRVFSYRELDQYANRVACLITRHWPGSKGFGTVGLLFDHGIDMIAAILGTLKAGKAYVPIAPAYPFKRIAYMLAHSGASLVLSHSGCEAKAKKEKLENHIDAPLLDIDMDGEWGGCSDSLGPDRKPDGNRLAYIMYTSGSTGKPKGVTQNHGNVLYYTRNWTRRFSIDETDRMTLFSSFCHDGSVQDMFAALLKGAALYPYDTRNPDPGFNLSRFLLEEKITIWHSVPSLYNFFVNTLEGGENFAHLRYILLGGEPFRGYEIEMFKKHFPGAILANVYGQTESSVNSIWMIQAHDPVTHFTIGEPLDKTRLFIVDSEGRELGPLETGEILVASHYITPGYWQGKSDSQHCFGEDPELGRMFWTGDLGRLLPDGNIEFIGRKDFQVKIRGFRVELGEIETTLLQMRGIKEAAVITRQSSSREPYLCAFITADRPMDVKELRDFLLGELPDYMIPLAFIQLESMPLTGSGKIHRKALKELEQEPLKLKVTFVEPGTSIEKIVARTWQEVLHLEKIGINDNFFELGGNSFDIIKINNRLKKELGRDIPIVKLFQYPTVGAFANHLSRQETGEKGSLTLPAEKGQGNSLEIAVIGMSGRFPGAKNIDGYWENLKKGVESISSFSDRELKESGIPGDLIAQPNFVNAKGVLDDIECFDAAFFNYTPIEAELMDPQLRVFHECAWEALEHAGYNPSAYKGLIGLYAGNAPNHHWAARTYFSRKDNSPGQFEAGLLTNHFSTWVSYNLDLKGPAVSLQTACSTSLVVIHMACMALRNKECDMALAGGASIPWPGKSGYLYREGLIFSPDGHCRAFDSSANGTVFGDGAGVVVLKELHRAIKDRDCIHAIIKGSAINNDGMRKPWYTAPSIDGQVQVIKAAINMAKVEPQSIGFIETHGTATPLGDPIEIEALSTVFRGNRKNTCAIGSVKTNVGHLNAAAGVAGFIKTVMALKYRMIPPTLHFEVPNTEIDFINGPFYVNTRLNQWQGSQYPLRAGVSSFGFGGTNAHVVLEEAPQSVIGHSSLVIGKTGIELEYQLILLSAKTQSALEQIARNLAGYFKKNPDINLADAAYTLQLGRKAFPYRRMLVASTGDEIIAVLAAPGTAETYAVSPAEESNTFEKIEPTGDKDSLTAIGRLWLDGKKIDWQELYPREKPRRVPLPTYPFERQRYWIEEDPFVLGMETLKNRASLPEPTGLADWFYVPSWKRSVLNPQKQRTNLSNTCWLVFVNELNLGNLLIKELQQMGRHVVLVKKGETFAKPGNQVNTFTVNPEKSHDYDALFQELQDAGVFPDQVVHLWNVTMEVDKQDSAVNLKTFAGAQYPGFFSLLYTAKAIGKREFSHDIHITVITDFLQEVTGEEALDPVKSTVLGIAKVIPQEYPGIRCRTIDVRVPSPGTKKELELTRALVQELGTNSDEPVIAYRNNQRWVQVFEPFPLEEPAVKLPVLKDRGVYLITGGLGEIGLIVSELLVKHAKARLVLTGRSHFPAREEWHQWLERNSHDPASPVGLKIKKLLELEQMGGTLLYIQADAADLERMQNVVNQTRQAFGPINGVIHSAGLIRGQSLQPLHLLSADDCRLQFRAKVYGLTVLEELFQDKHLDFCWVLSSISCVLGGLGLGAYASANCFMDAFVKEHNRRQGPGNPGWFCLNWDGMDVSTSIAAFERVFSLENIDQMVFSKQGNLQYRIDQWIKLETLKNTSHTNLYPRPDLSAAYIAPRYTIETVIAGIWQELMGFDRIGIRDDFLELGGDSLKAITVISKIHQQLNVNIPIAEFFKQPTIEAIGAYIKNSEKKEVFATIAPTEKQEYYILSSAQKRLYILHQWVTDNISYNISRVLELNGALEKEKLEETFKKLIRRHESLRTSFHMLEEEPVQKVHDHVDFEIEYYQVEVEVGEMISNFIRPFDLSCAPLLRVGLIQTHPAPLGHPSQEGNAGDKYILMVDIHHIISDLISADIFVKDFIRLYEGEGENLPLPRIQYKDFSQWQGAIKTAAAVKKQEAYWLRELAGDIPLLNLPADYPRPAVQSFEGAGIGFKLSPQETKRLNEMARMHKSTLFMVLLAVYYILLSKLSSQEDIIVGTPVVGRRHVDLDEIIGVFINVLALRACPAGQKTFNSFLAHTRKKTLDAFDNQDYPFEDLVEKKTVKRDMSRNPLFDVMFFLQETFTTPGDEILARKIKNLEIKPYPHENRSAKFDLSLGVYSTGVELNLHLEYCTKLFNRGSAERFIGYFKNIISGVLRDPAAKISGIEIISPGEKKQVLVDFNDTETAFPSSGSLGQLFEEQVQRTPDNIAVVGPLQMKYRTYRTYMTYITYRELNDKSNHLALLLQAKGVGPDTIVAIMTERCIEMVIGILGILKAGGAYLPIDPDYPQDRIDYMLKDSDAKIFLTGQEIARPSSIHPAALLPFYPSHSSNLAYILYTSGSTGKPKGVIVDHESVVNILTAMQKEYPLREADAHLLKTSYLFDVSVTELFGWFWQGGRLVILERGGEKDPSKILDTIERAGITHINFVPSMFNVFVDELKARDNRKLSGLRYIFLAGEVLLPELVNKFRQLNTAIALENIYGPTEGTVYSSKYSLSGGEGNGSIPIGKPMQNIRFYILDKDNHLQSIGVPGELCIAGVGLARGYLNNPGLTAQKFQIANKAGYYRSYRSYKSYILYKTGDLGRWRLDGNIEFLGRLDYQVKIRGYRVELGEIQSRLKTFEHIKDAVVVAGTDERGDKYLIAYITGESAVDISQLRTLLLRVLPYYMVPSYFVHLETLPLTSSGKIDIKALPGPVVRTDETFTGPGDVIQDWLAKAWSKLIGIKKEEISIHANFFELGGQSLKALMLTAMIHKKFNVKISLTEVFQTPTIKELSQTIKKCCQDKHWNSFIEPIVPVEKKEYYRLSSAQERFYTFQQMDVVSTVFNMTQAVELQGEIDRDKLQKTFHHLIRRHNNFRTSFNTLNQEPVQKVHHEVEFEIEYYDKKEVEVKVEVEEDEGTSGLAPLPIELATPGAQLVTSTIKDFILPFDLSKAPLLRVGLMKINKENHLLIVDMHHIISDGISQQILYTDFMSLYEGMHEELSPLRIQYKDYSVWQASEKQEAHFKQQEEYWLKEFADGVPELNLETDFPRPDLQAFEGSRIDFILGSRETKKIKTIGLQQNATTFMVLLAVFNVFLYKLCGKEDILLGTVVAARNSAELEKIVGCFINLIPLRNYPSGEKRFIEFLLEVKQRALQAFENQDYPFEELVDKVVKKRDLSRHPLFDVGFTFTGSIEHQADETGDIEEKPGTGPAGPDENRANQGRVSIVDFALRGYEEGNHLIFSFYYCTKLFKRETIMEFIKYFSSITVSVCEDTGKKLKDIELMPPGEMQGIRSGIKKAREEVRVEFDM